jgi:predicted unusual protein kinase regulating ubiquinone biosynthesis (AarF/ABC1/UbiB family)
LTAASATSANSATSATSGRSAIAAAAPAAAISSANRAGSAAGASTASASTNVCAPREVYDPHADRRWLLRRPWILISRLSSVLWQLGSLTLVLLVQGKSSDADVQRRLGRRILATLTSLGPCFIKVGQALSTRPDLVRRDWLEELTQLQDNLPPFPQDVALATIEAELGARADQLFEEFPDYPMAAASLGQVYRARLSDGRWVAVKVQRPGLERILRRDLVLIRFLAVLVAPALPLKLGVGLSAIIDEFGRSLFEEIDYRCEADNAERFAVLFDHHPEVTVPRVERQLSSRRVLTTSWIHGTKLQERRALEAQGLDPSALIRTCVIAGLRQLLEFGYFHADPHPGNLFALPGRTGLLGHVAYVDFGMMDSITDEDRLTLTGAVVHLINRDFRALAEDFVALGFLTPDTDREPIIPALEEVLGGALGENVGSFNFKSVTDRFSELMFDYPFRVPARFALIIRAVVSQEGLALRLDPDFKIIRVAYPYVARRLLSGDTAEMREKLLDVLFDSDGRLRVQRLENLLAVVEEAGTSPDLLPVMGSGLKLLLGPEGSSLRQRLLLTLVQGDHLHTEDLQALAALLRRTFTPAKLAGGMLARFNPLAAAPWSSAA